MRRFRRRVLGALLLGTLAFSALAAQRPLPKPDADAAEAYAQAQDFLTRKDWRSARVALLNAVKADPAWPAARLALAETALRLFDPVLALEQLDKAAALGVDPGSYVHLLAHAQWMSGEPAQAVATLSNTPVVRRNLPYAYRVLGRAQMDLGDTIAAGETFDKGLAIAPDDSLLWTETGRLRMVISNQAGAIEALDRALAIDSGNVRALELRGRLVRSQFGMLAALPWFERGLAVDANDVPLLEEYGATLGEAGRYRDMLAQARKILQLDTRNQRGVYMQAVIAARAKNFALARRLLEQIAEGFGELPAPQLLRAVCEYELGNPNRAIEILGRLNRAQPDNEVVRLALARALHKSGDQDGAWAAVAPWAARSDAGSYAERLAARVLEAQDRRGDAAQFLDRAAFPSPEIGAPLMQASVQWVAPEDAANNPRNAAIVIPRIRIALAQGNMAEARTAAGQLLQGNEGVADAQMLMGDVEWLSGNGVAAVSAYEKARALSFSRGVLTRLVSAYRAGGNDAAARETIAAYAAYNPADVTAMRMLAFDLMDRAQWADALPLLLLLRARTGLNDSALNANIARSLSEMGRHDEAVRMARLGYRIDPASLMTTRTYGNALLKAKRDPKNARALLRKASKLAPANEAIAAEYRAALAMNR